VENFVPGVMARLGCDHATLSAIKPDLVSCSISGFGQSGPLSSMTAFAHIINAVSGLMSLKREPNPHPCVSYLQAVDVLAGTNAFVTITARSARVAVGTLTDSRIEDPSTSGRSQPDKCASSR
jgi:CoA:oxalate CoA-transferase